MRILFVVLVLLGCAVGIIGIFWKQNLQYSLPTPVPASYQEVSIGTPVSFPALLPNNKAHFIHFYSPDCPCSRFNARHIKSLIHEYDSSIAFVIIVPEQKYVNKAKAEFGEDMIVIPDHQGVIAKTCGVYSTPQAAIIDHNGKLYYRGNYNSSRYCTTKATNFAELSLVALLNNRPSPAFGLLATQAYGCELATSTEDSPEFF